MLVRSRRAWEIRESQATPEAVYLGRRQWLKGLASGAILAAGAPLLAACDDGAVAEQPKDTQLAAGTEADPTAKLYPVPRNERYTLDRR